MSTPLVGELRIAFERRIVVARRDADGKWTVDGDAAPDVSAVAREVMQRLRVTSSVQTFVTFEGSGVEGRIRDGGGPRESWVVDYDALGDHWAGIRRDLPTAFVDLFTHLDEGPPPDSDDFA